MSTKLTIGDLARLQAQGEPIPQEVLDEAERTRRAITSGIAASGKQWRRIGEMVSPGNPSIHALGREVMEVALALGHQPDVIYRMTGNEIEAMLAGYAKLHGREWGAHPAGRKGSAVPARELKGGTKRRRSQVLDNGRCAVASLYPHGVPDIADLPDDELRAEIEAWLRKNNFKRATISKTRARLAAGRDPLPA